MKKILSTTAFLLLFIFNCLSQETFDTTNFKLKPEYFDRIGLAHNEGLDYVFEQTFKINKNTTPTEVNASAIKFVFEVNPETKESKDNSEILYSTEQMEFLKKVVSAKSLILDREDLSKKLSGAQLKMVEELNTIFLNNEMLHSTDKCEFKILLPRCFKVEFFHWSVV